jgi:fumarate reductase flavoprotein subunit
MGESRKIWNIEKLETDIVIIGGGGSGLAAAVAAAEKGAKVIVVEKRKAPGGNSALACGLFATESRIQKDMRVFVATDDAFKIMMNYSRLEIDPRIIRAFLDKSGDTIRWLEEKGIEFDNTTLLYDDRLLHVWHCPKGGHGGADIVKTLAKNGKDLGVRFLFQAPVKKIVMGKKGNVTGILAGTEEKEFRITARSVIIATGGHGSNKELLKKYHPSYSEELHYTGTPLMGDGLLMAEEIGASIEGWGTLLYHGPFTTGAIHNPGVRQMRALLKQPFTVWVNKRGERFVNEDYIYALIETANALDRQPGKVSYSLLDEKMKQSLMDEGLQRGSGYFMRPGTKPDDLDKGFRFQAEKGEVGISDSWDGIARWIGAVPKVLKSTIDEYNRFSDHGYDKDFLKDRRYLLPLRTPPYYAIKCVQTFLDTIGGIKINHRMEVLNHDDHLIPGLYAVGVTTGGWQPKTYCIELSGNAFGFAINSGRIGGENAAQYAKGRRVN